MQERLRTLRETNDPFWKELNEPRQGHQHPITGAVVAEDIQPELDKINELDDSAMGLNEVLATTQKREGSEKVSRHVVVSKDGGLSLGVNAESLEKEPDLTEDVKGDGDEGRGKRKKMANCLYHLKDFTRHWDKDSSDIEA